MNADAKTKFKRDCKIAMTVAGRNANFTGLKRKRKWILRTALALMVLFLALIAAAFFFPQKFLTVDSGPVKAEALIVLGGGSRERPARAAELFKNGAAPIIIISGAGDDQINRRILIQDGVPANKIGIESRSKTTAQNAQFTMPLLHQSDIHSAIIVTSWYHSRRALKTFEHYSLDQYYPSQIKFYSEPSYFAFTRADWRRQKISKRIYLEFLKLPGYWVRYGVCPF